MTRILHCSDLHLDTSFAHLGLPVHTGSRLRAELRSTLGSICSEARRLHADVLTIAGDLFEQANALPELARFLVQQFERMESIQVFIAPGESDPYSAHSLYALTRWPANVHIFTHPTFERLVVSLGLTLWGAACPPTTADGWQRQIVRQPDAINLLLAHAPALPHSSATAFHVSESALAATGIDLALLGGSHGPQLPPPGNRILYPGSLHPLAWGEPAARRGAVLVSIAGGHIELEQICLPSWRLAECAVDLAGCRTAVEAAERVEQALEKLVCEPGQTLVANVELEGEAAESFTLKQIRSALTSETEVILRRPFRMMYDLKQLALEPTVRGTLVQRAQEQLAVATDEIARTELLASLQVALMALEGRQVHPDAIG